MVKVTIKTIGPTPQQIEQQVLEMIIGSKAGVRFIGVQARDHMRNVIKTSKKRGGSRGNLEKAIKVHTIAETTDTIEIGIGNIPFLNTVAPYWRLLNQGGLSPLAKQGKTIYGYFGSFNRPDPSLRGTGRGSEPFFESRFGVGPSFPMTPKSPISPVNYIEKTNAFLSSAFLLNIDRFIRKFKR